MDQTTELSEVKSSTALAAITIGGDGGGLALQNMDSVSALAQMMSKMGDAVPRHLQGKAGPCAGVIMQAVHWEMDPFVVANKSYLVNGRISFEAQLIHAVINRRAPITSIIRPIYYGEGDDRTCTISATAEGEEEPLVWTSPKFGDIEPKNSPLWTSKPDMQLFYNTVRDWCRMYFPDVILGVYTSDEMADSAPIKNVTPKEATGGSAHFQKLKDLQKSVNLTPGDEMAPVDINAENVEDAVEVEEFQSVRNTETMDEEPFQGTDQDTDVAEAQAEPDPDEAQDGAVPDDKDPSEGSEAAQDAEEEAQEVTPDVNSQMYQDGMDAAEFFGDDHIPPSFQSSQEEVDYHAGHAAKMEELGNG